MAISEIYNEFITENIIKDILLEGEELTLGEVDRRLAAFLEKNDTSLPLFDPNVYKVAVKEPATVAKFNSANAAILQDLQVLYLALLRTTDKAMLYMDRWRNGADTLRARLFKLEDELTSLLLLTQDTEGYFGFVSDVFENTSLIDMSLTTALIDLINYTVTIGPDNVGATRISLNNLRDEDVRFSVLTSRNLQSSIPAPRSSPLNSVIDTSAYWQNRIYMRSANEPAICELVVKLGTSPVNLTRIVFQAHSANSASPTVVTPQISADGINFSQLPINEVTKNVISSAVWNFPTTSAKVVKFIMTKLGYDLIDSDMYVYEFGAKNIAFFSEGYDVKGVAAQLFSTPLKVLGGGTDPIEFNKLTLEVCERVPDSTRIAYYITVSDNPGVPIGDDTIWLPIDPVSRKGPIHPVVLGVGDLTAYSKSDIEISYDPTAAVTADRNPNADFTLLKVDGTEGNFTSSDQYRYSFVNSTDRILNFQIQEDTLDFDTIELWRNVGTTGDTVLVRDIQRGWGFSDPYYITTIKVINTIGLAIDFGAERVLIDDTPKSGKIVISQGIHSVKVHRKNWVNINAGVVDLDALIAADSLFPYNHKHLIEGYDLDISGNPYKGADVFAEFFMKRASVFDIVTNMPTDKFNFYAIDLDTGDDVLGLPPSHVFLLKVDEAQSDYLNEKFLINAKIINKLFSYARFRVDFSTKDSAVSPSLDGYRIKFGK